MTPQFWIDGRLCGRDQAKISVLDHGLLYGDGIFEGLRFYHGQPFRWERHIRRLHQSAQAIALDGYWQDEQLLEGVRAVIAASGLETGYLRVILTRGEGSLGIDPSSCTQPSAIIICDELRMISGEQRDTGLRLITSSLRRAPATGLDSRVKSLNYLLSVMGRIEARQAGADDAILLNTDGGIAEATAANLFCVREGTLLTPPTHCGALGGITRATVLELADALKLPWREEPITAHDIYCAEEAFLTGSGARLAPVRSLDDRPVQHCPGPVYRRLSEAFETLIETECGDRPRT